MDVEYRELPEFDGYRFGSDGSVWSLWGRSHLGRPFGSVTIKTDVWKKLNPILNECGHLFVNLRGTDGVVRRNRLVHHLVILSFGFPRPSPRHECRHENDIKTDNRVSNLLWGTRRENALDSVRNGTARNGKKVPEDIASKVAVLLGGGATRTAIIAETGLSRSTIGRIKQRIRNENLQSVPA
jgi:hypothetical protein